MIKYEKTIRINDDRILKYNISDGFAKDEYTIMEGFIKDDEIEKTYYLRQWDDYGFTAWINDIDKDIKNITYEFDMNHPLYIQLIHLLNYDEELIIDDDDTSELNKKCMRIYKKEDKIIIDFINLLEEDNYYSSSEKFHVFIKNIATDGRSKIDCQYKDTKERLFTFFDEVYDIFTNDHQQISIEEYLVRNDMYEEAKVLRKDYNYRRKEIARRYNPNYDEDYYN